MSGPVELPPGAETEDYDGVQDDDAQDYDVQVHIHHVHDMPMTIMHYNGVNDVQAITAETDNYLVEQSQEECRQVSLQFGIVLTGYADYI